MNLTGHSERNRKPDVYIQSIWAALPSKVLSTTFHTFGTSKHQANTKTSGHKEHYAQWSAVKENSTKRPSFLRLDSQGECSKNEWLHHSSHPVNTYSGTGRMSAFSDILRCYADTSGQYQKPEPVKQYGSSLNIASAVKLLCQKNDFQFPCPWKKASVTSSDGAVMAQVYPLQCRSKPLPSCTEITVQHTQLLDFVSSLQFLPEEQQSYCKELQYDFHIPPLSFSNLLPVSLPSIAALTHCGSTYEQNQYQHENSVDQLSVVPFRSTDAVDNCGTLNTRWVRRQIRQPRYNCRRKWLYVRSNTRLQKSSARTGTTNTIAIDRSASDCELVHSDVSSDDCSDSRKNELTSNDSGHDVPQYLSSVPESVTACDENDVVWLSHCYSDLPLPSSLYNVQRTPLQESCSFSSLFFVSSKEMEDSDFCSTDGEDSDCSGFLSPTSVCQTNDVLADAVLSGLPCIQFADTWLMGCFSDCTTVGFDSDFKVYFKEDEDAASIPCDYDICQYSLGVHEANARWNEAYSFPADVLFETSQHQGRMVQFSSDVSMVSVPNQLEWADAYQQARCGPWEQYARDRERFARRIHEVDCQIGWVLNTEHRATKYNYLQTCIVQTDSSSASLFFTS